MENVVDDTTPELGGDLDVLARSIVSSSNRNIAITPNGTGLAVITKGSYSGKIGLDKIKAWENELLIPPTRIVNGHLVLPDLSGLGFKLNESLVSSKQID